MCLCVCMCLSISHAYSQVSAEDRRGCQVPRIWSFDLAALSHPTWVLRTKLRSSTKAVCTLNCWANSPVPLILRESILGTLHIQAMAVLCLSQRPFVEEWGLGSCSLCTNVHGGNHPATVQLA